MTDDEDLFIEKQAPGLLPLFEGKMIWQYSHQHEQPQYWLDAAAFDERMRSKELHRMAQDLGVPKAKVAQQPAPRGLTGILYGWRFGKLPATPMSAA